MQFLAHRANLSGPGSADENSISALTTALHFGFGVETDVRDARGEIVISHDAPTAEANLPSLKDLLRQHRSIRQGPVLAFNVKSDGLRGKLRELLQAHEISRYFCFDMSVPEMIAYRRDRLRFFTRESEYEPMPALYADAAGVWLDMFDHDSVTPARIREHVARGKEVALVSPELHKRPHLPFWTTLRTSGLAASASVMLCTDYPQAAKAFFHE